MARAVRTGDGGTRKGKSAWCSAFSEVKQQMLGSQVPASSSAWCGAGSVSKRGVQVQHRHVLAAAGQAGSIRAIKDEATPSQQVPHMERGAAPHHSAQSTRIAESAPAGRVGILHATRHGTVQRQAAEGTIQ